LKNTLTILLATAVLHNIAATKLENTLTIVLLYNIAVNQNDFEAIEQYENVENEGNRNDFPGGNAAMRALIIDTVFM
jgi:hypothetical protein